MHPLETSTRHSGGYREAVIAGGCFALVALLSSFLIVAAISSRNNYLQPLIVSATVSAFFTGALLWRLFFGRGRRPTFWVGFGVGALVGTLSHVPAWYLLLVWVYFTGGQGGVSGQEINPLYGLVASIVYSALSVLIVGWITAPVGGLVGGLMANVAGKDLK